MMRILCTADVHIGRSSSGDGEISGDPSALGAWERIVEIAIGEKAHAVAIAGDFFDGMPALYVTRDRVRRSFEKLRAAGIPALAVAGNHDHAALREFWQANAGLFHLFPTDHWGSKEIGGVRFVGRSFPSDRSHDSLLRNFDGVGGAEMPTVGIVHADVNANASPYGPTALSDFAGKGVAAWLVGHVHRPSHWQEGRTRIAYPGSPQALDWGETDQHGFRWLTLKDGAADFSDVVPVSTVRYEYVDLILESGQSLYERLADLGAHHRSQNFQLRSAQYRLNLGLRAGARAGVPAAENEEDTFSHGEDTFRIVIRFDVPEVDLAACATQDDARGQAARLLLALSGEGRPEWRERADALVGTVAETMIRERSRLRLPQVEELESLRRAAPHEALNAVKRAAQKVLLTTTGARR